MSVRDDIMSAKNPFVGEHLGRAWSYSQEKCADIAEVSERKLLAEKAVLNEHANDLAKEIIAQQAKLNALIAELREYFEYDLDTTDHIDPILSKYENKQ
jgi:hypothetical protein